ncbi:MAG TPA: TetR/AcrR family transcriptional regulator [bacterium]|nr:TetR/AcrR family transcriptional regulator [bacterium]
MKRENKKLSRRERERSLRRAEILAAARKVFGARGYEGATLDEVAREAEFAKGTLYSYFDSKAELFAALVEHEFDEFQKNIKEVLAREPDAADAARAVIAVLLEFFQSRSDFYRVAMSLRETGKQEEAEKIRGVVMKRVNELADLLGGRFAEGIREGFFKEYDARFLGFLLLGIVHYYSVYMMRFGPGIDLTKGTEMLCDIYLDGVRELRPDAAEE